MFSRAGPEAGTGNPTTTATADSTNWMQQPAFHPPPSLEPPRNTASTSGIGIPDHLNYIPTDSIRYPQAMDAPQVYAPEYAYNQPQLSTNNHSNEFGYRSESSNSASGSISSAQPQIMPMHHQHMATQQHEQYLPDPSQSQPQSTAHYGGYSTASSSQTYASPVGGYNLQLDVSRKRNSTGMHPHHPQLGYDRDRLPSQSTSPIVPQSASSSSMNGMDRLTYPTPHSYNDYSQPQRHVSNPTDNRYPIDFIPQSTSYLPQPPLPSYGPYSTTSQLPPIPPPERDIASSSIISRRRMSSMPRPALELDTRAVAGGYSAPMSAASTGYTGGGREQGGIGLGNQMLGAPAVGAGTAIAGGPRFRLVVRQQPERARLCSFKEENDTIDRRPVDPPPVIQILSSLLSPSEIITDSTFFMRAILCSSDPSSSSSSPTSLAHSSVPQFDEVRLPNGADATTGEASQTPEQLRDLEGREGAFVVFGRLSVRMPGVFRLRMDLYQRTDEGVWMVGNCYTEPFEVYSPKLFMGMKASTALTRCFSQQGLKIKLRAEAGGKGKKVDSKAVAARQPEVKPPRKKTKTNHSNSQSSDRPDFSDQGYDTFGQSSVPLRTEPNRYNGGGLRGGGSDSGYTGSRYPSVDPGIGPPSWQGGDGPDPRQSYKLPSIEKAVQESSVWFNSFGLLEDSPPEGSGSNSVPHYGGVAYKNGIRHGGDDGMGILSHLQRTSAVRSARDGHPPGSPYNDLASFSLGGKGGEGSGSGSGSGSGTGGNTSRQGNAAGFPIGVGSSSSRGENIAKPGSLGFPNTDEHGEYMVVPDGPPSTFILGRRRRSSLEGLAKAPLSGESQRSRSAELEEGRGQGGDRAFMAGSGALRKGTAEGTGRLSIDDSRDAGALGRRVSAAGSQGFSLPNRENNRGHPYADRFARQENTSNVRGAGGSSSDASSSDHMRHPDNPQDRDSPSASASLTSQPTSYFQQQPHPFGSPEPARAEQSLEHPEIAQPPPLLPHRSTAESTTETLLETPSTGGSGVAVDPLSKVVPEDTKPTMNVGVSALDGIIQPTVKSEPVDAEMVDKEEDGVVRV